MTVGPGGGIFVRDGAVLDVPAGAVAEKVNITVTLRDTGVPAVPGRKRVSLGYLFSPKTLTFKQPVKVILPYLEARVPKGVDPGTFDERRSTETDAYLQLPGSTAHPELTVVEAQSDRLGLFWVTSPEQPAVSKVTLDPAEVFLRVGGTQQFTAKVTDPAGNALDVPVTFGVVPGRVATLDTAGLLTATDPGSATVTARAANESATALVHVQGDTVGPKSFVHENPFPTGNDLWGGTAVSGSTLFVGTNATALVQSAADEWTRLASSPGITLKAAGGTSPDDAVAVGTYGTSGVLIELKGTQTPPAITLHATVVPRALWFDGTFGMAVGDGNDVLVRRGGAWTKEYSPSIESLLAVIGDGQGAFTTLGSRGSLYRYDPSSQTWNSLFQTQLAVLLSAGALSDAQGSEAWAAGGGKLWHFQGGAWSALNLPATPAMNELSALGRVDGKVVVGARSGRQGYLLIYNPGAAAQSDGGSGGADGGLADGGPGPSSPWSLVALRGPQVIRGIFGQGAEGWAVGDFGAIWRYTSGAFSEVSRGFYGDVADVAVVSGQVYAAVNECATPACTTRVGQVMTRTGPFQWALLGSGQPFIGPVFSVAATSPAEVLAGGDGEVFRFDGTSWTHVTLVTASGGPIYDLQYCGATVYAVGPAGQSYKGSATELLGQASLGTANLHAANCSNTDDLWLAGDLALWEKAGAGAITARNSTAVNQSYWRAVWSPGPGEAFAFGQSTYGVYWDTADLTVIDSPGGIVPDELTGLWGSSPDNLYAVGGTVTPFPFGYAVRFDGVQWLLVDSGSQRKVTAIHGDSATEIWLGTEGGGLLRAVP